LGGGLQKTPSGKVRKWSKSRMRRSEDGQWEQQGDANGTGSTARRPLVTAKTERRSLDFIFESGVEGTNHRQQVLLPSIELQLPSPPRTLTQSSVEPMTETLKGKLKEMTNSGKSNNMCSKMGLRLVFKHENSELRWNSNSKIQS